MKTLLKVSCVTVAFLVDGLLVFVGKVSDSFPRLPCNGGPLCMVPRGDGMLSSCRRSILLDKLGIAYNCLSHDCN